MRVFLAAVALVATTVSASAEKVAYKCSIDGARQDEWIQPLIFVAHDRESGRVVVSDALILGVNEGQPAEGKVAKDNGARTTFVWSVDVTLQVTPVRMEYRGTFVKSTGRFSVVANPRGYENNFTRGGRCDVSRL